MSTHPGEHPDRAGHLSDPTGAGDFTSERGEQTAPERADAHAQDAQRSGEHADRGAGPSTQADVLGSLGAFGSFDAHRPPSRDLMDDCVHCGFCLPTCPTYALWGEEMDSPRGRIYLMEMAERGEIPIDGSFTTHMDRCLGCMACVTSCPSGVQYDRLLEATRPQIERNVVRSRADKWFRSAIFALFPYRRRLRAASLGGAFYQRIRPARMDALLAKLPRGMARLVAMESLLPPVRVRDAFARMPELTPAVLTPAHPARRGRVGMLTGCIQDVFFHPVNQATARVLAAEGYDVVAPRSQGCCGALGMHAGREQDAIGRAKELIDVFERAGVDAIAVNVAGCGSSMKEYGELLADDPEWAERAATFSDKVRDVSEVLARALEEPRARRSRIDATVVYHDACHLGHAQKIRDEPRAVLRSIPGVELTELPEAEICCGSAGVYNLLEPEAAGDLGRRKADHIRGAGADLLVTANPGCLLQIRKYLGGDLPMMHLVELLDASIRGESVPGVAAD